MGRERRIEATSEIVLLFYRPSLFWNLNGYEKNIARKKIQFFVKKLELSLPFELEIPMERSKFKIGILKF
jgi:hypothetical protein